MKRCPTCQEEFSAKFAFCPVDGSQLGDRAAPVAEAVAEVASPRPSHEGEEYHPTILEDEGLTRRLTKELREVAQDNELNWKEFKRHGDGIAGPAEGGGETDEAEVKQAGKGVKGHMAFHMTWCLVVGVETGSLYVGAMIHHAFEEFIREMPPSFGIAILKVTVNILLVIGLCGVLKHAWKQLRR